MSANRPGVGGYLLAVFVVLLGVAGAAGILVTSFESWDEGVERVMVPGENRFELAEPGSYTIYHEYRSEWEGAVFSNPEGVSGLTCVLRSPSGDPVEMERPIGTQTYSLGAHSGQAILTFEAEEAGTYTMEARYPEIAGSKPRAILAIGNGIVGKILFAVFGAVGIGLATFVVATIIFVITLVRRMKVRKEA